MTFLCTRGGADTEICAMNADGTGQRVLTNNTSIDGDPACSPDGRRISFERDLGANNRDLRRMRADGANEYNITDDGTTRIDANPSWQPR